MCAIEHGAGLSGRLRHAEQPSIFPYSEAQEREAEGLMADTPIPGVQEGMGKQTQKIVPDGALLDRFDSEHGYFCRQSILRPTSQRVVAVKARSAARSSQIATLSGPSKACRSAEAA